MKKHKLTPWFQSDVKPVYYGWYETNNPHADEFTKSKYMKWWNGCNWSFDQLGRECINQNMQWRGVLK